jgi:hypothetical protein
VVKWRLQNVAGNHVDCEKGVKAQLNNWCNFQHSLYTWVTVQRCVSVYAYITLHVLVQLYHLQACSIVTAFWMWQ